MLRCTAESLFLSPAQTLVNTVNTVGVMGKGIALEFKRRYPQMFERYRAFCDEGSLVVGKLQLYKTPNKWVLNFPTKKHWRHPSKLEWIETGLQRFVETYEARGITSVSFPQLGTGNGGLPWETVGPLMTRYLESLPIPVFIHVRRNPPGFRPEHEDPAEVSAFSEPREQITFERFVEDLSGRELRRVEAVEADEPPPLPTVEISQGLRVAGEDLENLWYRLSQRGALSVTEIPGALRPIGPALVERLMELDYIRGMTFLSGPLDAPTTVPGIRLAPRPRSSEMGPLFAPSIPTVEVHLT